MTPSSRSGTIPTDAGKYLSSETPTVELCPEPPIEAASSSPGGAPVRIFGGNGRPADDESKARTRALIGHLSAGQSLRAAATLAHVKPDRVLGLLDDPGFRKVAVALLDEQSAREAA